MLAPQPTLAGAHVILQKVYARLACRRPRSPRHQTYGPSAPLRKRRKVHARATLAAVAVWPPSSLLARRRHERLLLRDRFDPGSTLLRATLVTTPEASTLGQRARDSQFVR